MCCVLFSGLLTRLYYPNCIVEALSRLIPMNECKLDKNSQSTIFLSFPEKQCANFRCTFRETLSIFITEDYFYVKKYFMATRLHRCSVSLCCRWRLDLEVITLHICIFPHRCCPLHCWCCYYFTLSLDKALINIKMKITMLASSTILSMIWKSYWEMRSTDLN